MMVAADELVDDSPACAPAEFCSIHYSKTRESVLYTPYGEGLAHRGLAERPRTRNVRRGPLCVGLLHSKIMGHDVVPLVAPHGCSIEKTCCHAI